MGAAGSGGDGLSMADAAVQKRVVLTSSQRGAVEENLFQLGARAQIPGGEGEEAAAAATGKGDWVVFYDNAAMALTLRDWWLCEKAGVWLLRVPLLKLGGTSGLTTGGYDELTNVEEILERVGLAQHAEMLRKGLVRNVEKLLAQAGVTPFARIYSDGCFYRLRDTGGEPASEASTGEAGSSGLVLVLRQLKFDAKFAEPQAIADLLFSKGTGARSYLDVSLAEFLLPGGKGAVEDGESSVADKKLVEKVSSGGFEFGVPARAPWPEVVAYLRILRPAHLRALVRAGVASESS